MSLNKVNLALFSGHIWTCRDFIAIHTSLFCCVQSTSETWVMIMGTKQFDQAASSHNLDRGNDVGKKWPRSCILFALFLGLNSPNRLHLDCFLILLSIPVDFMGLSQNLPALSGLSEQNDLHIALKMSPNWYFFLQWNNIHFLLNGLYICPELWATLILSIWVWKHISLAYSWQHTAARWQSG